MPPYSRLPRKPCKQKESRVKYLKYWEKTKTHQCRILQPVKLYFKGEGEIKTSQTNKNWGNLLPVDCIAVLKEVHQRKRKFYTSETDLHKRRALEKI